ncbi:MAG: 16S rRNA (uracil(1498)-N(3))-methyltransferase [Egibacteraceae bacterium]
MIPAVAGVAARRGRPGSPANGLGSGRSRRRLWEEATAPLRNVCLLTAVDELVLGIAPEGGLTADEVDAAGLPAAQLGEAILRTETVALVAASIVLYHFGCLGWSHLPFILN